MAAESPSAGPPRAPEASRSRAEAAPLETQDGWRPGLVAGAHTSPAAALRRGLSRAWTNRWALLLVWAFQVGSMLVVLVAATALADAGLAAAAVAGPPLAARLVGWCAEAPTTGLAAALGPGGIAAGLLWAFLDFAVAGGVLTLLHTDPARARPRELVDAAGVYLLRFVRLFAVAGLLVVALLWLDHRLVPLLGGTAAPEWVHRLRGSLTLAALSLAALLFDLALIRTVLTGSRRPLRRLPRCAGFLGRNLPRFLLLYVVAVAAPMLLAAGLLGAGSPPVWPLPFLVLYALGRTAVRLVAWGGELSLYRGLRTRELSSTGTTA